MSDPGLLFGFLPVPETVVVFVGGGALAAFAAAWYLWGRNLRD